MRRKYPCPKCLAAEARAKKATRTDRRLKSIEHSKAENARLTTEIQEAHADSQGLTLAIEQLADELSTAQATNAHLRQRLAAQAKLLQSAQEVSARARAKISYLQQVAEDEAERAGIYVAEAERARVEINYLQAVAERQQVELTAYQSRSSPMPATPRHARRWAAMGWLVDGAKRVWNFTQPSKRKA